MKRAVRGALVIAGALVCSLPASCAAASSGSTSPNRPKLALDAHAIARAKRTAVRFDDFPQSASLSTDWYEDAQWRRGLVNKQGLSLSCRGHVADQSAVTFKGGWSRRFERDTSSVWVLTSAVVVLGSPSQARMVFNQTNTWTTRYCFSPGTRIGAHRVVSIRQLQAPQVADQQAEFSIRWSRKVPGRNVGSVIILLRRDSVFMELTFDWARSPVPSVLINAIATKVAARAGSQ